MQLRRNQEVGLVDKYLFVKGPKYLCPHPVHFQKLGLKPAAGNGQFHSQIAPDCTILLHFFFKIFRGGMPPDPPRQLGASRRRFGASRLHLKIAAPGLSTV